MAGVWGAWAAVCTVRGGQERALLGWPRRAGVCVVTRALSSRNLLANPFNCNCQLAWLGDWLRKRKIVTGNPRCQNPDFLRQIPLQDVAFPDFRCEEGNSDALPAPGGRREGELGQARGRGVAGSARDRPLSGEVGGREALLMGRSKEQGGGY